MQFTTLPGSDLSVSRLCLGTMTFGSPVAEPDAIRLVHDAAELGVNFIDTANMYEGYNRFAGSAGGVAEDIVGKAVAGRRADFVVATKLGMKVGDTPVDENTSPEAVFLAYTYSKGPFSEWIYSGALSETFTPTLPDIENSGVNLSSSSSEQCHTPTPFSDSISSISLHFFP